MHHFKILRHYELQRSEKQTQLSPNLLALRMHDDVSRLRHLTNQMLLSRPTSVCSQSFSDIAAKGIVRSLFNTVELQWLEH